ncbi:MAG: DUF11 domain-containing protein [Euryarchaeota archaeon]|nr:DUF11 domain-containing protein [Euryarchaeota archaeon]
MENNTGLNFENGTFLIEVVEINPSYFVKANLTSWGVSKLYNLWEGEPITYDKVKVNSSFITSKDARITVVFPEAWGYPKTYKIEPTVIPIGIPNLVITKSADKTSINPGDVASFTIKVENTGNATAYNLSLTERLPTGFTTAAGSRFPPSIQDKIDAGASLELYYALKAVDPGSYTLEPTVINYGAKTSKSGQITIIVADVTQEKSNLTTVISIDRTNVYTDELIKADVRITNTGKAHAKSVLVDGAPPLGTTVVEGDFRQVYDAIAPGEVKEYRVVLKAQEEGNYSINLRTVYNDDPIGSSTNSERITVTRKEGSQLYIILPIIFIIMAVVILTIKRHKEYSY